MKNQQIITEAMETKYVTITLEEYKMLLEIKGRYEESKAPTLTTTPTITWGSYGNNIYSDTSLTCKEDENE